MKKIRLGIVDDHEMIRKGIKDLLTTVDDIEICMEASLASQAITLIKNLEPDVVLIDLSLHGSSGFEVINSVKPMLPHVRFLVLTLHDSIEYYRQALLSGADGMLNKHISSADLIDTIRKIEQGQKCFLRYGEFIEPELFLTDASKLSEKQKTIFFTKKEKSILNHLKISNDTDTIRKKLKIEKQLFEVYIRNILRKLELNSFSDLLRLKEKGEPPFNYLP